MNVDIINRALKFIGDKLDKLGRDQEDNTRKLVTEIRDSKKTIELDLTTRAIEKLQDSSNIDINKVAQALENVATVEGKRLESLTKEITGLKDAVKHDTSHVSVLERHEAILTAIKDAVEEARTIAAASSNPEMAEQLSTLIDVVSGFEFEQEPTDLTPVVAELKEVCAEMRSLKSSIEKSPANTEKLLALVAEGLGRIKLEVPKEFKLEDMQMRTLSRSGGNGMGGTRMATGVTVANVSLTLTNTEYSYTFPANTVSFTMKMRDPAGKLYYAFTSGKMPAGGDSSLYGTVGNGEWRSQDNVEWSLKTIYLGSDTASMTAELTVYTM